MSHDYLVAFLTVFFFVTFASLVLATTLSVFFSFLASVAVAFISLTIKVMWEVLFIIGYALPLLIGNDLFNFGPSSTVTFEIRKFDSSNLKSFTADATALFNSLKTGSDDLLTANSKMARA